MRHQHHKRQEACVGDCSTTVFTTWVPYTPAADPATSTSTVTVQTTQMVFVDQSDTATVTYTATDGPAATGASKAKRAVDEKVDLEKRQYTGLYAMTYTGYDPDTGACMDANSILADLQDIKSLGFPRIRMYSVDCNQLSTVADQAIGLGLSVTLGVYLDDTGTVRGYTDLDAILAWAQWDSVDIINIGNHTHTQPNGVSI